MPRSIPETPPAVRSPRRRSARISPDRPAVAGVTIVLVAMIMAASYVYSFTAIADAAAWAWGGQDVWVRWLAPVFIDGAIITYTLSLAVVRWRGEPVRRTMFFLTTFTGISVAVNFAHAGAAQSWDFARLETWFACLIGIAAPLAALFAADEATKLVFTREDTDAPAVQAPVDTDAPAVQAPVDTDAPAAQEAPAAQAPVDAIAPAPAVEEPDSPATAASSVDDQPEAEAEGEGEPADDAPADPPQVTTPSDVEWFTWEPPAPAADRSGDGAEPVELPVGGQQLQRAQPRGVRRSGAA